MSSHQTAAEFEASYIRAMGSDLGAFLHSLRYEVTILHARWQQYRVLFASMENLQLLNRTAGFLFRMVQDAFWEQTLLGISRLTDPASTSKKKNLSIQGLLPKISDSEFSARVKLLVEVAVAKATYAREHRNKRLAHNDLATALSSAAAPVNGVSRACVEDMLKAIRDVMNTVELEYVGGIVSYEHFISDSNAESLIDVLSRAEKASPLQSCRRAK